MRKEFYNNEVVDAPILNDKKEPVSMPRLYGNLQQATNSIVVSPLQDIQKAIDAIYALGGGVIMLAGGTYYPKNDIILKSNCELKSQNSITATINFNGGAFSLIFPDTFLGSTQTNLQASRIQVTGSSTHGVIIKNGAQNVFLEGIDSVSNSGDGFNIGSVTGAFFVTCNAFYNAGTGFSITGGNTIDFLSHCGADGNGSYGMLITSSSQFVNGYDFIAYQNTSDGILISSSSIYCRFYDLISISNGRYGLNIDGSNAINIQDPVIYSNTNDGVRIDSNSDRNRIVSGDIKSNGGWGILINNANCDKNLLAFCNLNSNTSGTISDAGTGTVSVNHIT